MRSRNCLHSIVSNVEHFSHHLRNAHKNMSKKKKKKKKKKNLEKSRGKNPNVDLQPPASVYSSVQPATGKARYYEQYPMGWTRFTVQAGFPRAKFADASAARLADEAVRAAQAEVTSHQPAMRSGLKERKAPASSDLFMRRGAKSMTGTDLLHRRRDAIKRRSAMPPREILPTKKRSLGRSG